MPSKKLFYAYILFDVPEDAAKDILRVFDGADFQVLSRHKRLDVFSLIRMFLRRE